MTGNSNTTKAITRPGSYDPSFWPKTRPNKRVFGSIVFYQAQAENAYPRLYKRAPWGYAKMCYVIHNKHSLKNKYVPTP